MEPGQVVDGRFVIERVAGTGGMGVVYRALDREDGSIVAVKVARFGDASHEARLLREAESLASLEHPGIVRHVAHGRSGGELYVAMEWLEGEDLAARLSRVGLTLPEAIAVLRGAAQPLAALHARGLVHRDIKPSNLFLVAGGVKLVDLGIARRLDAMTLATRAGSILGTPGYLSPEQARGSRVVDARADVFSLGCVAYECITGQPAFLADHPLALLAKIVIDTAPRLHALRPGLPAELDALVAAMLAKRPESRPSMQAVALALEAFADLPDDRTPEGRTSLTPAITATEQRLLSVVVIGTDTLATLPATGEPGGDGAWAALRPIAAGAGAQLERLADGSLLLCFAGGDAASDQAHVAARAALAVRAKVGEAAVALATGLAIVGDQLPLGEVVSRGAALLGAARDARGVRIDDVTRRLLDARFEVVTDAQGAVLVGERLDARGGRPILGRPTPFVGREREVGTLLGLAEESFGDRVSRVAVVSGDSGIGKSRVREEIAARLVAEHPGVEVWSARAEPLATGSAYAVVGSCVGRALGLPDAAEGDARRAALGDAVEQLVGAAEALRVTHFAAELIGAPFPDGASVALDSARREPSLMAQQTSRAFEDLVAACTRRGPLAILVEDLQWSDEPSVRMLDATLRRLGEAPVLLVAFARPEVDERFPRLWSDHALQRIALGPLTRRAASELARAVLGDDVTAERLDGFVSRARGNPLLLEELLRAEVEGRGGDLPENLLAIVQVRLAGLDSELRRVLRAASVFGSVVPSGGVGALLGGARRQPEVAGRLRELVEQELLERRPQARFADGADYAFRHDLLREAAHATLTPDDRVLAHRLAAEWLVRAGERDAAVLAAHYDHAHERTLAAEAWATAAEQLVAARDLAGTLAAVSRAAERGATGETLARARRAEGRAHLWRGDAAASAASMREALGLVAPGTEAAYAALTVLTSALATLGQGDAIVELVEKLLDATPTDALAHARAVARVTSAVAYTGHPALLERIATTLDTLTREQPADPGTAAWIARARATLALVRGDVGAYLHLQDEASVGLRAIGDVHGVCGGLVSMGWASVEIGDHERAIELLQAAQRLAVELAAELFVADARQNLGYALARAGRLDEALTAERAAITHYDARGDVRMGGCSRIYLAQILALTGNAEAAASEGMAAVEQLADVAPQRAHAQAVAADALLSLGRTTEARSLSEQAARTLSALGGIEEGEAIVRLMDARTLDAVGAHDAGRTALRTALERLVDRSSRIADDAQRASFLARVPVHAATFALARAWDVG